MNDWEKGKLREHWEKPGMLKSLLGVLPMVPYSNDHESNSKFKLVVRMTGISFGPTDMAQVYYMLEEDGAIVRDGEQPEPAEYLTCPHPGVNIPCHVCRYEIDQRGTRAAVRYRLAKPLAEF